MWQRRHQNFDNGQWTDCTKEDAEKFGLGGAYEGWEIREVPERVGTATMITDEQAEQIASEVYARTPVESIESAFQLDWELVRAGLSHANSLSTEDGCTHGNTHIVHNCLRCGAPVCCGKCCADEADVAGGIAYQLTKKLVIDMPTARSAVDAAIKAAWIGARSVDTNARHLKPNTANDRL